MNKFLFFSFFAALALLASCTDPTAIGGDLLDGSQLPISYRDDIPVRLTTALAENNSLSTGIQDTEQGVAVGCINSAYTGDLNSRVGMEIVERQDFLDLSSSTVDSIVLILPMATPFQIGDTLATTSLRVVGAVAGSIDSPEPLTSTPLIDNGIVYGETTVIPPRGLVTGTVFTPDTIRVDTFGPEIRIPLNQDFRDAILPVLAASVARDTISDSLFIDAFPGIIIEGSDCGGTLPSISLSLARINRMGVFVYYTNDAGEPRQYQLNYRRDANSIGTLRPEYVHNYVGSPAADLLAGNPLDDTLALVQSLSGLMVKVDFPDLSSLNNVGVNAAFLEIPIVPGTEEIISPLVRILPRIRNADGDLINYSAQAEGVAFDEVEGGSLVSIPDPRSTTSDSILAYRFNLTTFFQGVADGAVDPELFLVAGFQTQLPGESILVGGGGDANALRARLLLATTELP